MPDGNEKHSTSKPDDAERTTPDDHTDGATEDATKDIDAPALDPFDPDRLRLSQNFDESLSVRKVLNTVRVERPSKEVWFRTHPDPAYRLTTALIVLKGTGKKYLVSPDLWPYLHDEPTFGPRELVTTITRQNVLHLWPLRLPPEDGRVDNWCRSETEAANLASTSWIRIAANMPLGAFETRTTAVSIPEPEWPEYSLRELLAIAFRDCVIDDINHPVLKELRGEL